MLGGAKHVGGGGCTNEVGGGGCAPPPRKSASAIWYFGQFLIEKIDKTYSNRVFFNLLLNLKG